jgi:DNA-binding response OmpR family regulator
MKFQFRSCAADAPFIGCTAVSTRILLVDQDRLLKDLLAEALTSDICEVLDGSSISDAKTAMVHQAPDLCIVDAQLNEAIPFILNLQVAKMPVIALVNTDRVRDQLRMAEIRVADRRGSLAALIDAIQSAIDLQIRVETDGAQHVLVVDDEEEIRSILSQFLTSRGYATSAARDGIEALKILNRNPDIAVVLLDITMPRMSGLETLTKIMQRQPHPGVIMVSAGADTAVAQRTLNLGAFAYILKPPDFSEVEATVSACIACSEMAS